MRVAAEALVEMDGAGTQQDVQQNVDVILANENAFLTGMNQIVFMHDAQATRQIEALHNVVYAVTGVMVVAIVVLWFALIRPVLRRTAEIDKARSDFIAMASHQLRTPVTSIRWYAQMMLSGDAGKVTDEQKGFLDEIAQGCNRLIQLIETFLNIGSIESGSVQVNTQVMFVGQVVERVVSEMKPQAAQKQQEITLSIAPNLKEVYADEHVLSVIVENLRANALRYSSEKQIVDVSVYQEGGDVCVRVKDQGIGISHEEQRYIFDKMFRATNAKQVYVDGTGLGLYVAHMLAQTIDSTITFTSKEGHGSEFAVWIPQAV